MRMSGGLAAAKFPSSEKNRPRSDPWKLTLFPHVTVLEGLFDVLDRDHHVAHQE